MPTACASSVSPDRPELNLNSLALVLRTPKQLAAYTVKIRAFQILAVCGRICCVECGDRRWDVLHADHVNNDGYRHRKQIGQGGKGAGKRVYHWVLQHPGEARRCFQLLCADCHQLKTIYGFVPSTRSSEEAE
jgi:hypothetical protein